MNARSRHCRIFIVACLFWLPATGTIADLLAGKPPFTVTYPDIEVYPQHFSLLQTEDGLLYVGSYEGLLVYDGVRWTLQHLPNRFFARGLVIIADRLYVGGDNLFGYFLHDDAGQLQFTDLTERFSAQLEGLRFRDIWDIKAVGDAVVFMASEHLFIYRPDQDEITVHSHPGRFGSMLVSEENLIVQFRGLGLKQYDGSGFSLLPGSENVEELAYEILPLPDDGLLILSANGRWHEYRDGVVTDYVLPVGFNQPEELVTGLALPDRSLILAGKGGMMTHLDPVSGHFRQFQLTTERINALSPSPQGGVLALTDIGVYYLHWPAKWSQIGPGSGLSGHLLAIHYWQEQWLALTDGGVYASVPTPAGQPVRFEPTGWTTFEAWAWQALDDERGLLADTLSLHLVDNGVVSTISDDRLYPSTLLRSTMNPDTVFVGTFDGLAWLRLDSETPQVHVPANQPGARAIQLVEESSSRLWVATDMHGLWQVEVHPDSEEPFVWEHMASEAGIDYGEPAMAGIVRLPDGELLASTGAGFFRWSGERFVRTDLMGLEQLREDNQWLTINVGPEGKLWAWAWNRVFYYDGNLWHRENISRLQRGGLSSIGFHESGHALFGSSDTIVYYTPGGSAESPGVVHPVIGLREVALRREGTSDGTSIEPVSLTRGPVQRLVRGDFGVHFSLHLQDFHGQDEVRYQSRLLGYEEDFSSWETWTSITYSRLRPGHYRFEARGRDSRGHITAIEPFELVILPRWYATTWAMIIWVVMALVLLSTAVRGLILWRIRRMAADQAHLQTQVTERTRELAHANAKLERMANVDGLTGLANRRRLDAHLELAGQVCSRAGQPLGVILVDVDEFKRFNDERGHQAGDAYLQSLATHLQATVKRKGDLAGRYGGEEFLILLPGANLRSVTGIAEALRAAVENSKLGTTISAGAASAVPDSDRTPNELVGMADQALYQAKRSGKNRVCVESTTNDLAEDQTTED